MARIKNSEFTARYTPLEGTEDAALAKRLEERKAEGEATAIQTETDSASPEEKAEEEPTPIPSPQKPKVTEGALPALSQLEQTVYDALPVKGEMELEDFLSTGLPLHRVQAALTMLEIKGLVIQSSTACFRRT
jgi:hypothetical protein